MRIAQVTATFPPQYTGTGIVCYHDALGLARLGHEVTVFTANHPPGQYAYPEEITVHRLPPLFRLGNAPILPRLLSLRGFDIIHLHHPFIFGSEMIWAVSRIRRIPYIITHHNDLIGNGVRRLLFNTYSTLSTPLIFNNARRLVVVSKDHATSSRLAPLFRKRWNNVVEIPNGVDTDRFNPDLDGTPIRCQHGIPGDAKVILFVGVLDRAHHYRRLDILLKAVKKAQEPNLHLLVAGGGDLLTYYQDLAKDLDIETRAHFIGGVAHQCLPAVYAAADVVVLPSQLQESFGLVLIEAMACSKPVVASNLPGVRLVVSDGEDGLLVKPGDVDDLMEKMRMLLADANRRREMGTRGRAKVKAQYSWPFLASQLIQMYKEVLATC